MHWESVNGTYQWVTKPSPNAQESPIDGQYWDMLQGVVAIGTNDAWAVGGSTAEDNFGFLTHWNGTSWSAPTNVNLTSLTDLFSITAISPNDIWAAGRGGGNTLIWHSSDGGANWAQTTSENSSNSYSQFHGITVDKNSGALFAAGFYKSYQSGSWSPFKTLIEQYASSPTPITQWQSPQDGFYIQGDHVTLSVSVSSGADQITGVTFTASWDSNSNVPICNGGLTNGNWVCQWAMQYNGTYVRNGPITFGFTVTTATQSIVNPNGMRSGTMVYEMTFYNPIYAGYTTTSQYLTATYTNVVAKWIVPTANCGVGELSESAIWDGIAGKTQLAQIGTESNCRGGFAQYDAVWEVIPFTSSKRVIHQKVSPGDAMTATVTYVPSSGTFQLTLEDYGKWTSTIPTPALADPSERTHGECIVEAPRLDVPKTGVKGIWPLTDFGSVAIDCKVNGLPVANGPQDIKNIMVGNNQKARTNPLQTDGEIFTVDWLSRV